jgi:hypothetical protein
MESEQQAGECELDFEALQIEEGTPITESAQAIQTLVRACLHMLEEGVSLSDLISDRAHVFQTANLSMSSNVGGVWASALANVALIIHQRARNANSQPNPTLKRDEDTEEASIGNAPSKRIRKEVRRISKAVSKLLDLADELAVVQVENAKEAIMARIAAIRADLTVNENLNFEIRVAELNLSRAKGNAKKPNPKRVQDVWAGPNFGIKGAKLKKPGQTGNPPRHFADKKTTRLHDPYADAQASM